MLHHQNLTQQQNLYFQLKRAIRNRRSISNILEAISGSDLLEVLTTRYTTRFARGGGCTFTLLNLAIYKNNNECVSAILTKAQEGGILQEVLTTLNTIHHTIRSWMHTLTPLGFAIYIRNEECVNAVLIKAQEGGIL